MKITYTSLLTLLLVFLLQVQPSIAQDKAVELAQAVEQFAEYNKFSGAILVAHKGQVLYKQGIGWANREWNLPNTPDTRFQIGSVTKQFTAFLLLQMVEQGRLRLHEPLATYLPDYPADPGNRITLHHLLSHTSGLPHYNAIPDYRETLFVMPYSQSEYIDQFKALPLRFEPGEGFGYSSFGYYLLGVVLEKVSGKSYGQLLKDNIFDPVGMYDTQLDDGFPQRHRATPYRFNYDVFDYAYAEYRSSTTAYSTGGVFSTLEDLYRWHRALYTDALLSKPYRDLLFTPVQRNYGYGWFVDAYEEDIPLVFHNGGITGYTANYLRFINDDTCIIVLSNTRGYKSTELPWLLAAILYDQPYEIQPPLDKILHETIVNNGIDAAIQQYRSLKQSAPQAYPFEDENQLNQLGYTLMRYNRTDDALAVFHLNAEVFPSSWNVYDSLGEAYLNTGDREQAMAFYQKSLNLNPENTNAAELLEDLKAATN